MGIESDQLVYEYLSRVGDLAQRRALSSGDRMRLVSGLRDEIDRRRAKYEPETPAAVRRILERIGTPEEVLDTLGTLPGRTPGAGAGSVAAAEDPVRPGPAVPAQRGPGRLLRKSAPAPRPAAEPENVPPHLAGLDELGPSGGEEPDWWRVAPGAYGAGPQVEGFAGGIEIPDLFEADPEEDPEPGEPPAGTAGTAGTAGSAGSAGGRAGNAVRFLRERRRAAKAAGAAAPEAAAGAAVAAGRARPNVLLLLAAALLVAGAAGGYWLLLAVGGLLPFASRVLGPAERKWALFGPIGAALVGAAVWLWGRMDGRWGAALADDQLSGAMEGMWPWLVRGAALASAGYLVWRARR
ncbi:hypothetical protein ACWFQ8_15165 [Streptomyces sp. NPDC055254]